MKNNKTKKNIEEQGKQLEDLGMKSLEKSLAEREFFNSGYYHSLGIMFFTFLTFLCFQIRLTISV